MIKWVLGLAGLALIASGYIYSHNDTFKAECAVRKMTGASMGTIKNIICDVDFTVDN